MLLTEPRLHIWPTYFIGSETMEICAEDVLNVKYNMVPTPLNFFLTIWKGDNTWICMPACTCTHVCVNERRGGMSAVWVWFSTHVDAEREYCLSCSIKLHLISLRGFLTEPGARLAARKTQCSRFLQPSKSRRCRHAGFHNWMFMWMPIILTLVLMWFQQMLFLTKPPSPR